MKSALLVHTTNIPHAYTQVEFNKALVKYGYKVRPFSLVTSGASERAKVQIDKPELAILSDPILPRLDDEFNANISKLKTLDTTLFVNSLTSHTEACNKWVSFNRVINAKLPFVKTVLTDFRDAPRNEENKVMYSEADLDVLDKDIEYLGGFPIVYKSIYGSVGLRVHLINNKSHLRQVLTECETYTGFVLQEYISSAEAVMLCVRVVGEEVYPRLLLGSALENISFKSVISRGRLHFPSKLTDDVRTLAVNAINTLNLDTARIEMFVTNDGIKLCEINSLGSILSTDQVHNISIAERIVNHAVKKLENNR